MSAFIASETDCNVVAVVFKLASSRRFTLAHRVTALLPKPPHVRLALEHALVAIKSERGEGDVGLNSVLGDWQAKQGHWRRETQC